MADALARGRRRCREKRARSGYIEVTATRIACVKSCETRQSVAAKLGYVINSPARVGATLNLRSSLLLGAGSRLTADHMNRLQWLPSLPDPGVGGIIVAVGEEECGTARARLTAGRRG